MFIPKIWGFEDIAINEAYCGKRMLVKEQHRCSIHKHEKKDEVLMVGPEGLLYFEHGQLPDKLSGVWMQENDRMRVVPGVWHRFTAMRDTSIYEFSTHHDDSDSIRHVQGGKLGNDEFRTLLSSFIKEHGRARIIEVGEAGTIAQALHKDGRTIGMCNGCFDLMHLGHVELLMQAKNRCDVLFVGVNNDASVKMLKGAKRPFVNEVGRMGMVASNRNVDYVVRVPNTTGMDIVEAIRPDIYITTTEYGTSGPEAKEAERLGGIIEVVDMLPGYNTTKIGSTIVALK